MPNVIKRHQYADYLNVGTAQAPEFVLMGVGFTTLDEEPNAQTDTVKYVCDKASSTTVTGYETTFPFEAEQIKEEQAINDIYSIARNHAIGSDAERDYVRVELWDPVEDAENTFKARQFRVAVAVSEISGENKMSMSGNLNAVGDPVFGKFNTQTKTFTED